MGKIIHVVVLLALLLVASVANWSLTLGLPPKVATHFNFEGKPDGFMALRSYQLFITLFTLGFPLFMLFMTGVLPGLFPGATNIPNRGYWMASERKQETMDYLFMMACRMSCLMIFFCVGLNVVTVMANKSTPVQMPHIPFFVMLGIFLSGLLIWVIALTRKFKRLGP